MLLFGGIKKVNTETLFTVEKLIPKMFIYKLASNDVQHHLNSQNHLNHT